MTRRQPVDAFRLLNGMTRMIVRSGTAPFRPLFRRCASRFREQVWEGESGRRYRYRVYEYPLQKIPECSGNYIYTRYDSRNGIHIPVFIFHGYFPDHMGREQLMIRQVESFGVTHVHIHVNASERLREWEMVDLVCRYAEYVLWPAGCNSGMIEWYEME